MNRKTYDLAVILALFVGIAFALGITGIASSLCEIATICYDSTKSDQQRMREAVARAWH